MLKPFLNSAQIAQISADYLNANSLKSEIGVDSVIKSELVHHHFIDLKSDIDIEYTYQSGSLDDDAYQAARAQYETHYRQYEIAKTQWHAADEAARRANNPKDPHAFGTMGTHAPRPHAPTEPKREDYIRWGEYYTETIAHQGRGTHPVQPERLPTIKGKSFESYSEMKHFIPASVAEQEGFVFTKIDPIHVKNTAAGIHKTAADAAVADALKDYYHRYVSQKISQNRSTYIDLIAPIWDVTFNDDGKSKKMYIDEINGVIDGEKIDESKVWAAILGKHAVVLVAMCTGLMQIMGGFVAFLLAAFMQWGIFYGLYLYHKTSQKPSADLAKFLDFFYIRELANQADAKTAHHLDQYLIGLDAYEAFISYKKQRESALLQHTFEDKFVALNA
jgi:hypothetical protein